MKMSHTKMADDKSCGSAKVCCYRGIQVCLARTVKHLTQAFHTTEKKSEKIQLMSLLQTTDCCLVCPLFSETRRSEEQLGYPDWFSVVQMWGNGVSADVRRF